MENVGRNEGERELKIQAIKINLMEPYKIICPKCGSDQVTGDENNFITGTAQADAVLSGWVGKLAGIYVNKKFVVHCLDCGEKWKPQTEES